ncbi:MAG: sigma-70 family RNA polymerase sigma factor [Gemmatimonadales bacterium]
MATDWGNVYRETYLDLVRFLHRKVWDADRAQDLAQEVFVRALDADPENARAWLFTVAANLARDEARSAISRRKQLVLLKGEAEARREVQPEAGKELERREQMELIRRALDELNERDRTVLLLWDGGLDYGEIAAETGLSRGAVGTTLARARRKLVDVYDSLEGGHVARG